MNFDEYLQQANESAALTIDSGWAQGNTTFGGLSAALLLQHLQNKFQLEQTLRSLSVNFCGALHTEQPASLSASTLRQGRSIGHYQAIATQNDEIVTLINACFAKGRESNIEVEEPRITPPEAGEGKRIPYIKGMSPEFTRHIDFAYVSGGMPFTNSKDNHVHGWMRFKEGAGHLTNPHLVALIDSWPPTIIQKIKGFAPCATVSWNLELITPLDQLEQPINADDWLWYEAEIRQAHDGYGHTEARIYTKEGIPLALSRQLVVAYDKKQS